MNIEFVSRDPSIDDLRKRLHAKQPRVRRIALADLQRQASPPAFDLMLAHLEVEPDTELQRRIVESLGQHRYAPAAKPLAALRDGEAADPVVVHAARIACDRIERSSKSTDDDVD